ncbi:MAG: hypothetical protein J3K34DRAFT_527482 [Monoraphidium minutum]|nr:MAG: hypothetical protein J3K34DRAFT_527482 [Monoraphidium minutum]
MAPKGAPKAGDIWTAVDAELAAVGADKTDPKFYALKHVVEILSSSTPQAMVEELREQEARLMALVDALAAGYHSGFARSIQNYSQILQLFGDSAQQVDGLKKSLADAHRQLAVQSRHLHQQWRKSMMLEAQTKLLADVQLVVDAPGRIQAVLDAKDWPAAVALLQDAAARLARDSLMRVLALRKVRSEVAAACASVQAQLLEELNLRTYGAAPALLGGGGVGGSSGGGAADGGKPGRGRSRLAGSGAAAGVTGSIYGGATGATGGVYGSGVYGGRTGGGLMTGVSLVMPGAAPAAGGGGGGGMPQFVADALAERDQGAQGTRLASLRELVACLVDGLDEAKAYLTLHARGEIRRMVRRTVEAFAIAAEERAGGPAALAAALGPPPGASRLGGAAAGGGGGVAPALQAHVSRMVKAVADQCLAALANLGRLLQEVADAPPEGSTPALIALKQQHGQQAAGAADGGAPDGPAAGPTGGGGGGGGGAAAAGETGGGGRAPSASPSSFSGGRAALEKLRAMGSAGFVRAEYEHAWQQVQEEVQLLLAELLAAVLRGPPAAPGGAGRPGGWLADFAELASSAAAGLGGGGAGAGGLASAASGGSASGGAAPGSALASAGSAGSFSGGAGGGAAGDAAGGGRLVFSLEVGGGWLDAPQLQAGAAGGGAGGGAAGGAAAAEVGAAAKEAHSYGPLLARALAGHKGGPYMLPAVYGPIRRFVEDAAAVMRSAAPGGGDGSPRAGAAAPPPGAPGAWLLSSLEAYVTEAFLPHVWVDLRGRCTAVLEDPDAFRPSSQFQAPPAVAALYLHAPGGAAAAAAAAAAAGAGGGRVGRPPPRAVVPAALFAAQVVGEALGWLRDVPCAGTATLTGVVDAILGRVLEAFAAAMMRALGDSRARRLVLRAELGLLMAGEPDAPLLADPMAFYVPRSQDAFDGAAFLTALRSADKPVVAPGVFRPTMRIHGFGLEGEAATEEVLLCCMRERPQSTEQLIAGHRTQALVVLAALSESLDFVADRIAALSSASSLAAQGRGAGRRGGGAGGSPHAGGGGGGSPRGGSPRSVGGTPPRPGAPARGGGGGSGVGVDLQETLAMTIDRYRSLGGACVRAIRLDLLLLAAHHLGSLAASSHMCEADDVRQVHPAISALTRSSGRAAEELAPYLGQRKAAYTLGCLAASAARYLMWAAQEIPDMNALGAERLIRTLAVMQGPLMALTATAAGGDAAGGAPAAGASAPGGGAGAAGGGGGGGGGAVGGVAEAVRGYERAKGYYTLITLPCDEVLRLAADKPLRYSVPEWEALLAVRVPGRPASDAQMVALRRVLDKTYNLSAGQKVAAALEEFGSRVQAPVATLADSITAGIKGGMLTARALLKQAAGATGAAAGGGGAPAAAGGGGGPAAAGGGGGE